MRAKNKGLRYDPDMAGVPSPDVCPVLGIPLIYGRKTAQGCWEDDSPTLDRIVPAEGYHLANVQVISWRANCLKRDATIAELKSVIEYMKGCGYVDHSGS